MYINPTNEKEKQIYKKIAKVNPYVPESALWYL